MTDPVTLHDKQILCNDVWHSKQFAAENFDQDFGSFSLVTNGAVENGWKYRVAVANADGGLPIDPDLSPMPLPGFSVFRAGSDPGAGPVTEVVSTSLHVPAGKRIVFYFRGGSSESPGAVRVTARLQ